MPQVENVLQARCGRDRTTARVEDGVWSIAGSRELRFERRPRTFPRSNFEFRISCFIFAVSLRMNIEKCEAMMGLTRYLRHRPGVSVRGRMYCLGVQVEFFERVL
jgi:hypothetical protein